MALMKCPECGHDVSDKADKCPNCGCPVSVNLPNPKPNLSAREIEEAANKNFKNGMKTVIIIILCLVVLVSVCEIVKAKKRNNGVATGGHSRYSYSEEIEATTFALAEKAVKGELKAPSTAKFCKQSECDFESLGNNQYMMTGWVDAENSFGAMIRSDWLIIAELDGTKMKLVSVLVG